MSQNDTKRKRRFKRPHFNLAYLKRAAEAYLLEELTYKQITERFGIKRSAMGYWVAKFSDEILQTNVIGMNTHAPQSKTATPCISPGESELRKALENANMKITALQTMIQLAEEELGIKISKKSGTKQ